MSTTTTTISATETMAKITSGIDNAKLSRDGKSVVVGYGAAGYLRLLPMTKVGADGGEIACVDIEGKLSRRNGGTQAELRAAIRALGIELRWVM